MQTSSMLLLSTGRGSKRAHAIARTILEREARHEAQQEAIRHCADIVHRRWCGAEHGDVSIALSHATEDIIDLLDVRPDYSPIP